MKQTFFNLAILLISTILFLKFGSPVSAAATCDNISIANVTNYDYSKNSLPWTGPVQVNGFGCVLEDGSNPGPWRLALLDSNGKVLSVAPQNGQALKPVKPYANQAPQAGSSYTLACIQVKGNGNEQPTGTVCEGITLTAEQKTSSTQPATQTGTTTRGGRTVTTSQAQVIDQVKNLPGMDKKLNNKKFKSALDGIDQQLVTAFIKQTNSMECKKLKNNKAATETVLNGLIADGYDTTPYGSLKEKGQKVTKKISRGVKIMAKLKCKQNIDLSGLL